MESIVLAQVDDLMEMTEAACLLVDMGMLTMEEIEAADEFLDSKQPDEMMSVKVENALFLMRFLQLAPPTPLMQ